MIVIHWNTNKEYFTNNEAAKRRVEFLISMGYECVLETKEKIDGRSNFNK